MLDWIIGIGVTILFLSLIYFVFIKKGNSACRSCSEFNKCKNKGKDLYRDYQKECKKGKKN